LGAEGARGLRPGQVLEVAIEKGVYRGQGFARHAGQVVFVPRGLPGDRLRVRVESAGRDFARAVPLARLAGGPGRREAPCPHAARCGGCAYQELGYAEQLALKAAMLRECLARGGSSWEGEIAVHGSPEQGWRARCTLHAARVRDELLIGLREEGSRRVVDLDHCPQLSPGMNAALRDLRAGLAAQPRLAGALRDLELAESYDGTDRVAVLVLEGAAPERVPLVAALAAGQPRLTGLAVAPAHGPREGVLPARGEPYLRHEVAGRALRAHARSFFQANRFLVERLVDTVGAALPPGGRLIDLYAGIGLFAVALGGGRDEVHAVEGAETAAADARENARRAGLDPARVRRADVLASLDAVPRQVEERIVLDPPRAGAGCEVIEALASRRPAAIAYVSCDPPTLARDLRWLGERGYRPTSVTALDMFPDTFHLEVVVGLAPSL
jgi:23S rRNA (uracil1939-C5)-methyltransferase